MDVRDQILLEMREYLEEKFNELEFELMKKYDTDHIEATFHQPEPCPTDLMTLYAEGRCNKCGGKVFTPSVQTWECMDCHHTMTPNEVVRY